MTIDKPRIAVHKFTSCDGCQLAFLNAGETLLILSELVDFVHFSEFGKINPEAEVEIAFVEGSISTPEDLERIQMVRKKSKYVITIGACATSGGIQALRNFADHQEWIAAIYASPKTIQSLATSTAIAEHIKVDWEIWGCPVNTHQVMDAIRSLLFHAVPNNKKDAVCIECKRQNNACVVVTKNLPCLGPVTQTGCGALCPSIGRACYGCYGPAENPNTRALGQWFEKIGFSQEEIARQFLHINNQSPVFKETAQYFKGIKINHEP